MKVKELMEKLKEFSPDAEVVNDMNLPLELIKGSPSKFSSEPVELYFEDDDKI
jgi:hypothetical protein